jgi:hypothetical protein
VLPAGFYLAQTDHGWYRDPLSGEVIQAGAPYTFYFSSNFEGRVKKILKLSGQSHKINMIQRNNRRLSGFLRS